MDLYSFITALVGFLALIGTTAGLFIWNRSEGRTDNRRIHEVLEAIKEESKEFHARLVALETRYFDLYRKEK